MRILVLGAGGMLGRAVVHAAGDDVVGLARSELDVTDAAAVKHAVARIRPDVVVNCAAFTDVDGAEERPAEAMRVNGDAAGEVAAAAPRVVYVSSDYVFDGEKGAPYVESDRPSPISAYGRSKLAGERATAAANPRHLIVRSSWLFGLGGKSFVDTMMRLGAERDELRGGVRPGGLPDVHRSPRRGARGARRRRGLRHPSHRGARVLLLVRARADDLRVRRDRLPARALHERGVSAAGPPAGVLGAGQRPRPQAAALAGRARRLPRRASRPSGGRAARSDT